MIVTYYNINKEFPRIEKSFINSIKKIGHSGNFILHTLPCIFIYYNQPLIIITHKHSFIALLLEILWVYFSTYGTMDLSSIYIKFSYNTVRNLYTTSIITTLSIPYLYNFQTVT